MSLALVPPPVNALGERKTAKDRIGNVHTYSYDVVGRFKSDEVTTLVAPTEGTVRKLEREKVSGTFEKKRCTDECQ